MKIRYNSHKISRYRSENDEETLSETKIRLDDDDEGYDDDGQGIFVENRISLNLILSEPSAGSGLEMIFVSFYSFYSHLELLS